MNTHNLGLSILISLTSVGDLLEDHLKQCEVLASSKHELTVQPQVRNRTLRGIEWDLENLISTQSSTMREQLAGVKTLLDHKDLDPQLKEPLTDLQERITHLVEHGQPLKERQPTKPLKENGLRLMVSVFRAVELTISALEIGAEAYDTLRRAKASYLVVKELRKNVVHLYEEMEANFIDAAGDESDKAKLRMQISEAETAFIKARIDYAHLIQEMAQALPRLRRLRENVALLRHPVTHEVKLNGIMVQLRTSLTKLLCQLQEKQTHAWTLAMQDINDYLFMQATSAVKRFRKEQNLVRDMILYTIDHDLHELLKRPA